MILVGAIAFLLFCEGAARVLAGQLPATSGWYSREVQAQVARIEQVSVEGGACVAFVGSSTVEAAIQSDVLTSHLGHDDWYVAWVPGANALLLEPWTEEVVLPKLAPEFVVIGLTSMEVNDGNRTVSLVNSYYESRGRRELVGDLNIVDRVYAALEEVSAFYALREYLRSPGEVVARITGRIPNVAPHHGLWSDRRNERYGTDPADMRRADGYVSSYALGGPTIGALDRMVEGLQEQGRHVALVRLPFLEEEWVPRHEHGWADIEEYRAAVDQLAERHGIPVFAYPGVLQDPVYFRDPIHLTGEGPAAFTEELGRDLRAWIDERGGCG